MTFFCSLCFPDKSLFVMLQGQTILHSCVCTPGHFSENCSLVQISWMEKCPDRDLSGFHHSNTINCLKQLHFVIFLYGKNFIIRTLIFFYLRKLNMISFCYCNLVTVYNEKQPFLTNIIERTVSKLKVTPPKKSSCLYVCQHCLVHLGDIGKFVWFMDDWYFEVGGGGFSALTL